MKEIFKIIGIGLAVCSVIIGAIALSGAFTAWIWNIVAAMFSFVNPITHTQGIGLIIIAIMLYYVFTSNR